MYTFILSIAPYSVKVLNSELSPLTHDERYEIPSAATFPAAATFLQVCMFYTVSLHGWGQQQCSHELAMAIGRHTSFLAPALLDDWIILTLTCRTPNVCCVGFGFCNIASFSWGPGIARNELFMRAGDVTGLYRHINAY